MGNLIPDVGALNQIHGLTRTSAQPGLRQLLELQLTALKERRGKVERGLAAVEAALRHLQENRSVSVDELSSLIRSFGMEVSTDSGASGTETSPVGAALERFSGHYRRRRAQGVSTIALRAGKLFLEPMGKPPMELEQIGDTEFSLRSFDLVVRFEHMDHGTAQWLTL